MFIWASNLMTKSVLKSFIVYCHINSDDDQRQLVEILVFDIINKTEICF